MNFKIQSICKTKAAGPRGLCGTRSAFGPPGGDGVLTLPKGLPHWEAPNHPRHVDRLSSLTSATLDNADFKNTYTIE
jgi:hypothetical protein